MKIGFSRLGVGAVGKALAQGVTIEGRTAPGGTTLGLSWLESFIRLWVCPSGTVALAFATCTPLFALGNLYQLNRVVARFT